MEENKAKSIYHLTDEIHIDVDNIYESLMDEDDKEAVRYIEVAVGKLRDLKGNIILKED